MVRFFYLGDVSLSTSQWRMHAQPWNDYRQRFGFATAINSLCSRLPGLDAVLKILYRDRIVRVTHHHRKVDHALGFPVPPPAPFRLRDARKAEKLIIVPLIRFSRVR